MLSFFKLKSQGSVRLFIYDTLVKLSHPLHYWLWLVVCITRPHNSRIFFDFPLPDTWKPQISLFFQHFYVCNGIFGFCLFSINILEAYHEMSSTHKLYIFNKLCFALHCAIPYLICLVWYNCNWIPHLLKIPVVI